MTEILITQTQIDAEVQTIAKNRVRDKLRKKNEREAAHKEKIAAQKALEKQQEKDRKEREIYLKDLPGLCIKKIDAAVIRQMEKIEKSGKIPHGNLDIILKLFQLKSWLKEDK